MAQLLRGILDYSFSSSCSFFIFPCSCFVSARHERSRTENQDLRKIKSGKAIATDEMWTDLWHPRNCCTTDTTTKLFSQVITDKKEVES